MYDRRDYNARTYDQRPHDRGFVQNGVYHRRENVNTQNTGATESTRSRIGETGVRRGNPGNAQDAIGKVRMVANAPRTMQGRSTENLSMICDSGTGNSNLINDVDVLNNKGN